MVARRALDDSHHIMRYVPQSKRFVSSDGVVLGPALAGFALRDVDEGCLSVTQIEYFGGMSKESRIMAAIAHRESLEKKKLGPKAIFAWAQVEVVRAASLSYGKSVRVVHAPTENNPAHAEIRHFKDDDLGLLEHLATAVFENYEEVGEMDIPPRTAL